MARKIHVQLIDDLSGVDAQETIRFSVDGSDYEIDLTADNAAELRGTLERYAAQGRRLRGTARPKAGRAVPMSRGDTQTIRKSAAENGYAPTPRGRIGLLIKQAYDAAQG